MRTLGPWANETHLAPQNVPELGNLIDANLANDASHARGARVAFAGPNRTVFFSVDSHRAKLRQNKRASVFPDSFLLVKNRATRSSLISIAVTRTMGNERIAPTSATSQWTALRAESR